MTIVSDIAMATTFDVIKMATVVEDSVGMTASIVTCIVSVFNSTHVTHATLTT